MKHNKPTLVTGANGLLGGKLLPILAVEHEVHALVRTMPKNPIPEVKYLVIDLSNDWSVEDLPQHIECVIHLAQSRSFRDFPESALDVFKVNIESTARLLDYACRVSATQFIYASSGGVYGNGSRAFSENSPIVPPGKLGYYLGSKMCGEIMAQSYSSGMQVNILRFFFMYGSRQKRDMLIPRLIDNIKAGRPIVLKGENGIRLNPIHVDDAVTSMKKVLKTSESATYNIAGLEVLSIREICNKISNLVEENPVFVQEGSTGNDLIGEISTMRKVLHEPNISLSKGIIRMII